MRMGKMGPNAKKREYRRHDLMAYLLSVDSTSYQGIREKLNVTDKTIRDDLAYLQDVKGIVLECQAGVGGYVRMACLFRGLRECDRRVVMKSLPDTQERLPVNLQVLIPCRCSFVI